MAGRSLTARTLEAFRWSALASLGEALLAVGTLAVLARLLSPRDFGVVAIAMVFVGLVEAAGRLGVGHAIVQRPGLTQRHLASGFLLSAGLGAALGLAVWAIAPATGGFFDDSEVPAVLGVLAAVFALSGLGEVSRSVLSRNLRFRELLVADILSKTAGYGLVAISMALLGYGAWSLVGGLLARQAVHSAVAIALSPPQVHVRPGLREVLELLRFGTGTSVSAALAELASRGTGFVIGSVLGAAALGHYVQAARAASGPARLGALLTRVLFPAMAQRQERLDRLGAVFLVGMEALSLVAVPASVFTAVCAPEIVALLFGKGWVAAVPVLEVLAMGIAFQTCNFVNTPVIRALGATYREAWRRAVYAAAAIAGVWFGLRWGIAGAAAGMIGARIVLHVLLAQLAIALLGLDRMHLMRCFTPALWAGAWSAAPLWLAVGLARDAGLPAAATFAAATAVWAVAFMLAVRCAPGLARPRCLGWALDRLPFGQLGIAGPPLRFALRHLDRREDCRRS